jgi:hypothetical protein
MKKKLIWLFEHCIFPLIVGVGISGLILVVFSEKPNIDAYGTWSEKSSVNKTKFKLDEKYTAFFRINIINNGKKASEIFSTYFEILKKNNQILNVEAAYSPKQLKKEIIPSKKEDGIFYEKLTILPEKASIEYTIFLNRFIDSKKDFTCDLMSHEKKWEIRIDQELKAIPMKPVSSAGHNWISSKVYASEVPPTSNSNIEKKSSILIGGYDPIILSNGVLNLLKKKKIISDQEANQIKKIAESDKRGVLFGDINLLKFNELILGVLLSKNIINNKQVENIIKNSKNAGGVLVSGYNIIVLEAEILNALLLNEYITLQEGQNIIDQAKVKR